MRWTQGAGLGVAVLAVAACATSKEAELEAVAKDWCAVIRASQVVPVYPLSEDLQPGDVFLVQTTVDTQHRIYAKKGFLPLDHQVARLDPSGYAAFYRDSFLRPAEVDPDGSPPTLPRDWLHRIERSRETPWERAPRAAFPAYSFAVKRGSGLNLAIPVHGIPFGLGVLAADEAHGTISIGDAHTLGIDSVSLYGDLKRWAEASRAVRDFLAPLAPHDGRVNYLRVVNRVFATGRLDVSMQASSSQSGGLDVGAPQSVAVGTTTPSTEPARDVPKDFETNATKLNELLQRAETASARSLPGGSLRVVAAGAHSITMAQTFDPPLVIGYLAFDVVIGPRGTLGPPVATFAVLNDETLPDPAADVLSGPLGDQARLLDAAAARPDAGDVFQQAAAGLGKDWESLYRRLQKLSPKSAPADVFGDVALAYSNVVDGGKEDRQRALNQALQHALDAKKPQ